MVTEKNTAAADGEQALIAALVDSRALYRDLVDCVRGCPFEVDGAGKFTFVGDPGLAGYAADALIGLDTSQIVAERTSNPFTSKRRLELNDFKLIAADGSRRFYALTLRPVFDEAGNWHGVRGIAEDMTEQRARDRALKLAEARDAIVARFVLTLRDALSSKQLISGALSCTGESLNAITVTLVGHEDRQFRTLGRWSLDDEPDRELAGLEQILRSGENVQIHAIGAIALLKRQADVIGLLVVARDTELMPWKEEELILLARLSDQFALALQDARNRERLEVLAHIDELTGLLNRRAFDAQAATALELGGGGHLLYIDLDHFKAVNDTLGHAAGDAVLVRMGVELKHHIRSSDLAGRRGGDEFVVLLASDEPEVANRVAGALIAAASHLRDAAGDPGTRLGMSIGIARARREESWADLTARADAALYAAKAAGRGCFKVAGD